MQILFFIIFTFYFATANAQENIQQPTTIVSKNLTDEDLINKAESLMRIQQTISMELASNIIRISESKTNLPITAKAHSLLGSAAEESKNFKQALHHFLQASLIYKNINDKHNQIISSVDYIDIFIDEKRYEEAHKAIDELLPIALEYGNSLPIALTLITKANNYYQQKKYNDAITYYTQAIEYLSSNEKTVQNYLGLVYKMLAQSNKRLKNRKKTAYFYNKALDIHTNLHNKELIASTLKAIAEAERHLGNLVIALEYSMRSLEVYKQIDSPDRHNKAIMAAGIIYRHIGRYEESLKYVYKAYLYYKKVNDINGIAKSSNQLGLIYTRLDQFDQARSFYQLSIDLPKEKTDQDTLASAYREMAIIDLNTANYESAMIMATRAYNIYQKESDKSKESLASGIIADIYRAQGDNSNAANYYKKSIRLAKEINNTLYQLRAETNLAGIIIETNTDKAITLLKSSVALSTQNNYKSETLKAYRSLHFSEKYRGNFSESLRYAEQEIALAAIIQKENDDNKLILAKANLYSHKMEIELESLREKAIYAQLELSKKNNEIEIAEQARTITELELTKNEYANIMLVLLLISSLLLAVFIYRGFIASKKRNRELDYLAARDPLTNCFNRRILFEHMKQDFSNKKGLNQYCIIMADIDYFKKVNDTYGHSAGDSVLSGVANIFQGCVRQNDIVTRFGGEEFCIILHQVSQNQAIRIAETMRYKIEKSRFEDITVTCSFGVTSIEFEAKTPAELIDQADLALYQSKSLGRNQVTLWNETLNK